MIELFIFFPILLSCMLTFLGWWLNEKRECAAIIEAAIGGMDTEDPLYDWWSIMVETDPVLAEIDAVTRAKEAFAYDMGKTCDYWARKKANDSQPDETSWDEFPSKLSVAGTGNLYSTPHHVLDLSDLERAFMSSEMINFVPSQKVDPCGPALIYPRARPGLDRPKFSDSDPLGTLIIVRYQDHKIAMPGGSSISDIRDYAENVGLLIPDFAKPFAGAKELQEDDIVESGYSIVFVRDPFWERSQAPSIPMERGRK